MFSSDKVTVDMGGASKAGAAPTVTILPAVKGERRLLNEDGALFGFR
jgi:hypothetical protein